MRGAIFALLILSAVGCRPRPTPIPGPHLIDFAQPPPVNVPVCPTNVLAVIDESCEAFFTRDRKLACAKCPGGGACYDAVDVVYCAAGGSCINDPNCFMIKEQP